ncbi:MAG TPA: cytochrome c oxidase subunit II [Thermoanaerobaculia bacterium]|nr:cytochrome c oxidase subunit II [Thermoanaerobaculia bacterium]HUM30105.1 cytochrome c oxidase subunit II [Thermoanaerobaculia bacterium]HXK68802.1 cytochrome c oxidase subunit II [Thermoanaerobaculia bacterium]
MNDPTALTTEAVNHTFLFITGISVFFLLLITFLLIFFTWKYSSKRNPVASQIHGNIILEIIWIVVPTLIVLSMFYYGYVGFKMMRNAPEDSMIVHVTGRMWDWSFEYENGRRTDVLYVPVNRPTKLILRSVDVIHDLYIPAFRIKQDAVPGRETYLWFKPETMGPADVFCAEFCGASHAYMITKVEVMSESAFDAWYAGEEDSDDKEDSPGMVLLRQEGCLTCHRLDRTEDLAPSFKGLYGSKQIVLAGGTENEVTVDDAYLKRAILHPSDEIVKGWDDIMPQPEKLSDEDVTAIIETLKTLP